MKSSPLTFGASNRSGTGMLGVAGRSSDRLVASTWVSWHSSRTARTTGSNWSKQKTTCAPLSLSW